MKKSPIRDFSGDGQSNFCKLFDDEDGLAPKLPKIPELPDLDAADWLAQRFGI